MLTFNTLLAFSGLNLSLCLIPSPEMVYVITQSSLQGRWAGVVFAAGICFALAVQVLVMAFGVSTLIQTMPLAFTGLKMIGACYLAYLAWLVYRQPIDTLATSVKKEGKVSLFRKGVAINITNPMNPLFLLLVFPNFVSPEQGSTFYQLLQLGFLLIVIVFSMFSLFSIASETIAKQFLQSKQAQCYIQRGAAVTMLCFAIILSLIELP